ncbi:MAG: DMT family transporter, partial [Candidatus Limnocylindrales bacterium]
MTGSNSPARADARALWLIFATLSVAWGSSFLFIKIGLDEGLSPLSLVSFRLWIASAFLVVVLKLTGGRLPTSRATIGRLIVLAIINVAIPFSLITWGELYITSALASILNGLVPLFTIVLAALILHDEPMTANRLLGLLIGFGGAVLLVWPHLGESKTGVDPALAIAALLAVAIASLSYSFSAIFIRRSIAGRPLLVDPVTGPRALTPVEIALPQCVTAGTITTVLAIAFDRPSGFVLPPNPSAWFAVAWLGVIGSGIAYLLFFRLIRAWG